MSKRNLDLSKSKDELSVPNLFVSSLDLQMDNKILDELNSSERKLLPELVEEIKMNLAEVSLESFTALTELNPDINLTMKEKIKSKMKKRADAGVILQNKLSSAVKLHNSSDLEQNKNLKVQLMPNPCVKREVEILQPVPLVEIKETREMLAKTFFSFEKKNPYAIFHVFDGIATQNSLTLVVRKEDHPPMSQDSLDKLTDFALTNEVITENSLFLLGSERPEHHIKGFTLKLEKDFQSLVDDPNLKMKFVDKTKKRLSKAFNVSSDLIIIHSLSPGSIEIHFSVAALSPDAIANLEPKLRQLFHSYANLNVHASFMLMEISASSFSPKWNRDFSVDAKCPKNEKRAGYDYFPPKGYMRYGLNVSGKFDGGNDTWLGMKNIPGEWAVAYHGTAATNILSVINSPLHVGPHNFFGSGIYCSPDVEATKKYQRTDFQLNTKDGLASFSYTFMCRVNVSKPHKCTQTPCELAESNDYTIHFTLQPDVWFVNLNNTHYEHIRCYGVLVRRNNT